MRVIALVVALAFSVVPSLAFADGDFTHFMCHTEESATAIAGAMVKDDEGAADAVAEPFVNDGTCIFLPVDIAVDISYRGKVFTRKDGFRVQVVSFPVLGSTNPTWFGIMPVEPLDKAHGATDA